MKYLRQFMIIMTFSLIGEVLQRVVPVPIPASVYGMLLLFLALCMGIVKLEQVETVGAFLSSLLPVLFVPGAAGILENWGIIKDAVPAIFLLSIVSSVLTFFLSGRISQRFTHKEEDHHE